MPDSGRRRRRGFSSARAPLAVIGAVAAVAGMGYWGWSTHAAAADVEREVAAAVAARDRLEERLGAFRDAEAREDRHERRRGTVVRLASERVNWERLVRELSAVTPESAWLTGLRTEAGSGAPAAEGAPQGPAPGAGGTEGIRIEGFAADQRQVARLLARAGAVPGLGEPRLERSEAEARGSRQVVRFVIAAPVDRRAQDRPVLTPVAEPGATP